MLHRFFKGSIEVEEEEEDSDVFPSITSLSYLSNISIIVVLQEQEADYQ